MKIRYKFNLISYLFMYELMLPNEEEWNAFYKRYTLKNGFNIACVGPKDSCKTTLMHEIIQKHSEKHISVSKNKIIHYYHYNEDNKFQNLITFCQTHTNVDKIVYIEYFDDLSDINQQTLKNIIDTYHFRKNNQSTKVHFLIESSSVYKIKDFIKSRMEVFHTKQIDSSTLYRIFVSLCKKKDVKYHENCFLYFKQKRSITLSSLLCFFEYLKQMNITHINYSTFHDLYCHLDDSIFSSYFAYIGEGNMKEANNLLFELHDDGYDTSDILFFLYEYVKQHRTHHYAIEFICKYLNEYYNGHNHKIFIIFLTQDIKKKKVLLCNYDKSDCSKTS